MKTMKTLNESYVAPTLDVCEIAVEEGFAGSNKFEDTYWGEVEEEF